MTCHSIEESFSAYFDTHHGACLGVLTPRWMQLVAADAPAVFARFARNIMHISHPDDKTAAQMGIEAYMQWLRDIKAPQRYSDFAPGTAFNDQDLLQVAHNAWRIYHGKIGRLKAMTFDNILEILHNGR